MPSPQSGWPSEQMCSCNELLLIGNSNVLICGFLVPDLLSVMLQFYIRQDKSGHDKQSSSDT